MEIREVRISSEQLILQGELTLTDNARGLVIFAHGSGSSRFSPRNRQVARTLNQAGFATLLFDLLTPPESLDRQNVFDIPLLANRLLFASDWAKTQAEISHLPQAYFGSSTGAGAALWAASEPGNPVFAVVSRGGRPDLALPKLSSVTAPTLLIVGGSDEIVIDLNERARRVLTTRVECELKIVPGATHLFEEPGALEEVSRFAVDWLSSHVKRLTQAA